MSHVFPCSPQGGKISQLNPTCYIDILHFTLVSVVTGVYSFPYSPLLPCFCGNIFPCTDRKLCICFIYPLPQEVVNYKLPCLQFKLLCKFSNNIPCLQDKLPHVFTNNNKVQSE